MTRVIVTGDRHWDCSGTASAVLDRLRARYGVDLVVVLGGAPGVDTAFQNECERIGVAHEVHPADWSSHGRSAGPIRNRKMVGLGAAFAIAVHGNLRGSKGTLDCVRQCLKASIPVYLINGEEPQFRRITAEDVK